MCYWLEKRSLEREKDRRTFDKIGGERWLEQENDGKTDASSPPLGSSQVSPLTASIDQVLMQIKDERALTFPGKLKEIPVQGQGISTAASTMTTDMTQSTATI